VLGRRRLTKALVVAQLAALLGFGALTVARFHIWAAIDEPGHYAFVQSLAEDGRLPLLEDLVSWQVAAITSHTWPAPSPLAPAGQGLWGRVYEAFQPPLYYLAAVPVFAAVRDHRQKVFALRAFGLALILGAVAVLWALARRLAAAGEALVVFAAGLAVLLWPGLLVRGITVSNDSLILLAAPMFLLAAWGAYERPSNRSLLLASFLLGFCLLSKLTAVALIPTLAWLVIRHRRAGSRRPLVAQAAAAVLPLLMLLPWLAFNERHYGAFTANAVARSEQLPVAYPMGVPHWGIGDLADAVGRLPDGALPGEWGVELNVAWVRAAVLLIAVVIPAVALVAVLRRRDRRAAPGPVPFFALPVVVGALLMAFSLLVEDFDIFLLRYLAPVLIPFAMAVAAVLARDRPARVVGGAAVVSVLAGLLWVEGALAYYVIDG
jgi:Dolichyl-phosphate-mannose-protein mannosyltransferase